MKPETLRENLKGHIDKLLIDEILQDKEDAKKYHEDRHKLEESFKKWEQRNKEAEKNRQLVKQLNEIDYTDLFYAEKVQEILEKKK